MSRRTTKTKRKKVMAKKTKLTSTATNPSPKFSPKRIRKTIFGFLVAAALISASALGLAAYKQNWDEERDLSVIGNGIPTVVQVHDPNCSKCRQLMKNTRAALRGLGELIQYKIADISTADGRRFQQKHNRVPHVTLMFFDKDGKYERMRSGVTTTEELRLDLTQFAKRK